jgi:alanyl aminopeptidase
LLTDPKDEIVLKSARSCPQWINANDQATGYYHVLYAGDLQQKLLAHGSQLGLHEKVAMLKNTRAMVRNGQISAGDAIALAREFSSGPDRELILAALDVITSVQRSVPATVQGRYAKLIRDSFGTKARELGWHAKSGEDSETRLLRVGLVEKVAALGEDPQLITEAKRLAQTWLKERAAIAPELTSDVLSVAAAYGDRTFYDQLVAAARQSRNRRERGYIVDAIGSFRDPSIARRALNLMLTGELDIRELTGLLTAFQDHPSTERVPWEFVTANYDALLSRLPSRLGTHAGTLLPLAGSSFCDEAGYQKMEEFFKDRIKAISGGERVLATTLEEVELCEPLRKAQGPELERYLHTIEN